MRNTHLTSSSATAGSGGAIADANAEASICPKGWKLPTSGPSNNSANDSFYNLLVNYGLTSSVTGSADGVNYNIATTPLYFVRSGAIHVQMGRLRSLNANGYDWSITASSKHFNRLSTPSSYYLNITIAEIDSSSGPDNRWDAFPLRCLARRRGQPYQR